MAQPFLYLASHCYGGLAHVRFMRSVLALRAACARRDIRLQLDLGGGEALLSRARAMMLARFLDSEATHLLFADGDVAFEAEAVVAAVEGRGELQPPGEHVLITREAAVCVASRVQNESMRFGDMRGATGAEVAFSFGANIDPCTRRYDGDPAMRSLSAATTK